MVDHQEMVVAFELSLCHKVIGTKSADSEFAIQFKNGTIQLIRFDEMATKYPKLAQSFFQERIKFTMVNHVDTNQSVQTNGIVLVDSNPPVRIIGCTDTGGIRFWCEFADNESRKVLNISLTETTKSFQALVLEYFNNHVIDANENVNFGQGVGEFISILHYCVPIFLL